MRRKGGPFPRWSSPSRWISDRPVRLAWLLACAGAVLYLCGLGNHGLWGAQEPYVGGIIREMADSGNWALPTLNGAPYLEKPPLYYAAGALVARLAHSCAPWVLRLPSALFALATMGWIAWLACRRNRPAAGWWAALCLGTSDLFFRIGHMAVVDMSLVFTVSVGLGCAWMLFQEPGRLDRWADGLGLALGAAFLAKGPLGPLLILLPLGAALALAGGRPSLGQLLKPRWGPACGLLLVLGWVLLVYRQGGWPCLEDALVCNSIGRFLQAPGLTPVTGALGEHREHPLFYLTHSPFNLMPWLLLAGYALAATARAWRRPAGTMAGLFLPLALAVDTLFLSVSRMRRAVYFLPLVPIIFLHLGLWLDGRIAAGERPDPPADRPLSALLGATGAMVVLAAAAGPWLLVRDYGIGWPWPLAGSALAAGLGLVAFRALRRGRHRAVLDTLLVIWGSGLLWLVLVLPVVKDDRLRRVEMPFHLAARIARSTGSGLHQLGLSEADLGMASLIVRAPLAQVESLEALGGVLAQDGPRIVLANPGEKEIAMAARCRGRVLQPERPRDGQQGTGLLVILNEAAWRSLDRTSHAATSAAPGGDGEGPKQP